MLLNISDIEITDLQDEIFERKQVNISVIRLDKIHTVISGNKLFKLHYFLENALQSSHKAILTFGGAYSNHLAATAYASKFLNLKSIGIIRGEKPTQLSHTLQFCLENGMELKFISRNEYAKKEDDDFLNELKNEFGAFIMIPEGGYHPLGAKGASLIMNILKEKSFSHICCATGTATTIAGLLSGVAFNQQIISIPVLKGMHDIEERISFLTQNKAPFTQLKILQGYDFGGYAKSSTALFTFMNRLYRKHQLPTDFVYTAKMMFGIFDTIEKGSFPKGSSIACLHTGGLQGNLSLPPDTLLF